MKLTLRDAYHLFSIGCAFVLLYLGLTYNPW